ncbi:hypothetical protein BDV93DRAFT_231971 [Ceratobasidium sp. AG-I]|nr:hypothetical protein BDV93DRAFT_231971 [Ceratobasidium sp. AG-I]
MPHETSMPAASRKAWNLKVIQRHDPDILCIWDQVSYVMLMQYSPSGWTKTSVEGSLFLFDRRGSPRYGFFILNRSSSQNYMHLLTPEDNLEVLESYVIFRAKGSKDAPVMGLWAGDPDHRQHLGDTLLGLHAHIKSGSSEPYYDPSEVYNSTQPPNSSASALPTQTPTASYPSGPANPPTSTPNRDPVAAPMGMQSLNDLFARLSSSASTNTVATSTPPPTGPDSSRSSLYTATAPEAMMTPTQTTGPLRGQALLDSLFAMASPVSTPAQPVSVPKPSVSVNSNVPPLGQLGNAGPVSPSAPSTGGDLLAQLFANINGPQPSNPAPPANQRQPAPPPPRTPPALPADPAILHSTKITPDRKPRRSPKPKQHRISVFDEDALHSRSTSLSGLGEDVLSSLNPNKSVVPNGVGGGNGNGNAGSVVGNAAGNGSVRSKPRAGRALVPFQSDTGPVYHPDPTRPHVSSRFPSGQHGEEAQVYATGAGEDDAEDEIFYGTSNESKGPSPRRQKRRQRNGRGGGMNGNANGGRNGDGVNLDRHLAGEALMQGIEWDDGVVDKQLFLQSIYALLVSSMTFLE